MAYQVPESAGQALGVTASESAVATHSEHNTRPPTISALERFTLVSQAADAPTPPALMPSILASPRSPTTELVSLDNEICLLLCFSNHLAAWPYLLPFLVS